MKNIGLGLAFLLEIIAFFSFAGLGSLFHISSVLQAISFVVLLSLLILFWSLFMAPRAAKKLSVVPYYISKVMIFSLSALVIFEKQTVILGVLFVVACLLDEVLLFRHNTSSRTPAKR